jgi:hypothetical protein
MSKDVFWISLSGVKRLSFIGIEPSSEGVTVNKSEDSLVDVKVDSNIEVLPGVVLALVLWEWQLVSLKEDSLWDA